MQETDVTKEIMSRVDVAIGYLSNKIGVGADYFWPILVKQQIIEGVVCAIFWIISIFAFAIFARGLVKSLVIFYDEDSNKGTPDGQILKNVTKVGRYGIGSVIFGALALITTITFFATNAIGKIFNPEYAALKDIFNLMGGGS